jgi:uncharacterized protein (TIGR00725 family)
MGGSTASEEVASMAEELGALIAQRGWVLLNGGRNRGVMAASARGAKRAGGAVIGILPDRDTGQASPDLDVAVVTGMGDGRNLINVLSSDVVIACPGALGTMCEVVLALNCGKRVILLGWEGWPQLEPYRRRGALVLAGSPSQAVDHVSTALAEHKASG